MVGIDWESLYGWIRVSNGNAGKFKTFNVVLKLNYSSNFNVFGSLVSGVLESLDFEHSFSYFKPVSLLGVRRNFENYQFSWLRMERLT